MNYSKIYDRLIDNARSRATTGYKESHHIVPRCLGGSDSKDNLVNLTPEEHYLAHQLLVRIYPKDHKLVYAANAMIQNRPSNKMYGWLRRRYSKVVSERQRGTGNSQYGTMWVTDGTIEKKIPSGSVIAEGWHNQRLGSFKKQENKIAQQEKKLQERLCYLRGLHETYVAEGFVGVQELGYEYSKPNLVRAFSKYLPEFTPQNGKSRNSK